MCLSRKIRYSAFHQFVLQKTIKRKMKKILFLFNGTAIKLRQVLLDDFSKEGYDCYYALPGSNISFWAKKYPQIHFIAFESFSGTSIGVLGNLKTFFKIKALIKEIRPDIVFLGNVKPNIYGGIAAYQCGIRNVYALISGLGYAFIEEPGVKRAFVKHICMFLYRIGFKHSSHVFFQNTDDRDFFVKKRIVLRENSSTVPGTGVDLEQFYPKPFPKQMTFFMAARLIKEKGVFHFVEAAKVLKRNAAALQRHTSTPILCDTKKFPACSLQNTENFH